MFRNNFVSVDEVLVNKEIIDTKFSCELEKCKGACCTLESDFGAPLLQEEIEEIEKILPVVKNYLPQKHQEFIEKVGFYEIKDGELLARSINRKECVFVYYDGDIALCGIEKAYRDRKINFIKPISCHLFPIRISKFGGDVLRYERFSECKPALEKGMYENISIFDFCKDSLRRIYGSKWYSSIKDKINNNVRH